MRGLLPWEQLPKTMRTDAVRPYYDTMAGKSWQLWVKRGFDLLFSMILLIPMTPVMLLIALLIRLDSPGNCVFQQKRVTQYGRVFTIYKFRTMVQDAQKRGPQITSGADPRVTRVGKPLRALRLDELPQLINILKGDMSFVGTRPEAPGYVAQYQPEYQATLLLPAGVTSRASILFKDEARLLAGARDADSVYVQQILPLKMRWNLASLRSFSLWDEARVMLVTVLAVIGLPVERLLGAKGRGAEDD